MATLDTVAEQAQRAAQPAHGRHRHRGRAQTGTRPPSPTSADAETIDPARLEALHGIVKDLHAGKSVEEVKPALRGAHRRTSEATEIAAMEQKLIEGGVPDSEVKRLCDVHVQVFADALEGHEAVTAPAGHPMDTFQRENQALLQVTASLRKVAEAIGEPPDGSRLGAAQGRARRHRRAARRGRQALPAQGEPALPLPRGPRRGGPQQGDVGDPRRHPRAHQAGAADHRRRRRRARREHLPRARQDGRRHGDQGGAGAAPDGDGHPERRRVGADPRRRGRHRLRLHRRRAGVADGRGGRRGRGESGGAGRPPSAAGQAGALRPPASSP